MLQMNRVRDFSKVGDGAPIPNLIDIQTEGYARFIQADADPAKRKNEGLEGLLREVFPIVSYDGKTQLEYISYELGEPRYNPQECRDLRLTYGMPFRIRCRLVRKEAKDVVEEAIYIGEIPIMIGGGSSSSTAPSGSSSPSCTAAPAWTSAWRWRNPTARCTRPASSRSAEAGSRWTSTRRNS